MSQADGIRFDRYATKSKCFLVVVKEPTLTLMQSPGGPVWRWNMGYIIVVHVYPIDYLGYPGNEEVGTYLGIQAEASHDPYAPADLF